MNIAGNARLYCSDVERLLVETKAASSNIKRLVIVAQFDDKSISYSRAGREPEYEDILSFIGMLDFAKMGYFSDLPSVEVDNPTDIGGIGWIDDDEGASIE